MNSQGIDNPPAEPLQATSFRDDDRWKLVLRVAGGREFRKSARLRNFLLYVCEKALTDAVQEIHEQQIGLEVFGRRPGYNPGEDNIVRVEARELRRRLERYFESEGADEPIRICIPKGSYAPVFGPAEMAGPAAADQLDREKNGESQPQNSGEDDVQGTVWQRFWRLRLPRVTAAWVLLIALLSFGSGLVVELANLRKFAPQPSDIQPEKEARKSPWLSLFDAQRPLIIVVSDAALVLAQSMGRHVVTLEDYSNGSYSEKLAKLKPDLEIIASRPYTSLTDAVLTARLAQAAAIQHRTTVVRYARDLKMWDLNDENLIFVGSAYSDPWILQFDQTCNFIVGVDDTTQRLYFLNKSPQAGEQKRYYAAGEDNRTNENYGLITYLPNSGHASKILILDGTNAVATEAAGDFITDPFYATQLAKYVSLPADDTSIPYFQLLLKVVTLNNTPSELHVIAHRIGSGSAGR